MRLQNKVVIITGASSGIGKSCAETCAREGATLVLASRRKEILQTLANELKDQFKVPILTVRCDVTQEADCKLLIDETVASFQKIDVFINNAGIGMRALFQKLDLIVIKKVFDVNFWGAIYCTKYALPYLLASRGSVIGISSIAGFHPLPGRTGYSASKAALNSFLDALRIENLQTGLHVMLVAPSYVSSNLRYVALVDDGSAQGDTSVDENRIMSTSTVAEHVVDGLLKRRRTIILTGQGKAMVWLSKLLPAWVDRLVYSHFTKEKNPLIN